MAVDTSRTWKLKIRCFEGNQGVADRSFSCLNARGDGEFFYIVIIVEKSDENYIARERIIKASVSFNRHSISAFKLP